MSSMRNKRNRLICFFITLFVFISGMYFETFNFESFKVDSVFVCAHTKKADSYISSDDVVIKDVHACTAEMIGIRDNTGLRQLTIRSANQRRDTKVSLGLLCQDIFSQNDWKFYPNFLGIQFVSTNQDVVVANYIHRSDGKKRTC